MNIQKIKEQIFMCLTLAMAASYLTVCFDGARELAYMQVPIAALLSQIGGTWNKLFRRIAIPTLFTISSIGFLGFHWPILLLWPAFFGVASLPFTFKGDKLSDNWFNWIWVVIMGVLSWLASLPVVFIEPTVFTNYIFLGAWTLVGFSLVGILSNIKATAKFFEWKLCEALFWGSMGIVLSCLVSWF